MSFSVAKGLSTTRGLDLVMLAEYSTRDLDEIVAARKLDGEGDELSLSVAKGISTTRGLDLEMKQNIRQEIWMKQKRQEN